MVDFHGQNLQKYVGVPRSAVSYCLAKRALGSWYDSIQSRASHVPRVIAVVCPDSLYANSLADDLEFFLRSRVDVCRFLPWEVLPFDVLSPDSSLVAERLFSLQRLLDTRPLVFVTTVAAFMQRLIDRDTFSQAIFSISLGGARGREDLIGSLHDFGYQRASLVEEIGQYAVRGAVVDFFPAGYSHPIRGEYFGDEIESLRFFDSESQRSRQDISQVAIVPVREFLWSELANLESFDGAHERLNSRIQELELPKRLVREIEVALSEKTVWPGAEHLRPLLAERNSELWDYLPEDLELVLCEPDRICDAADDFWELVSEREQKALDEHRIFPKPQLGFLEPSHLFDSFNANAKVVFEELGLLRTVDDLATESATLGAIGAISFRAQEELRVSLARAKRSELPLKPLADAINKWRSDGINVGIIASSESRAKRIEQILATYELNIDRAESFQLGFLDTNRDESKKVKGALLLFSGYLSAGFLAREEGFVLISEVEIFPDVRIARRKSSNAKVSRLLGNLSQLKEDDFIVHIDHGVGIYRGLRQVQVGGQVGDFLNLEYADQAKLLIPVHMIGKIQKYVGVEGRAPTLDRLGGKTWEKTKRKVREKVNELAGQLVKLYAEREIVKGHSFDPPGNLDDAFRDTFEFEETPDQFQAIEDVLADMARDRPMDRLVCGDVGYGKTEVALRATFKAISESKQVAVLVPTTVLADQHYMTFKERLEPFSGKVACVSRFFSAKENRETLERLSRGEVDVIVGTHRLLQKDVFFKDLGLLIIDEEHRFGVTHKERIKQFKKSLDVLTLTATPIPRTLHMSLVGMRDMSVIETAPVDRQLVRTYVATYDPALVREAIMRELSRKGQVFYIYNRVRTIEQVAEELAQLVPEARVTFAHGQMKEKELEDIMHTFVLGEIDVLVCTTIVESGLDIPNANTIIIRDSNRFGLAELYQLRGRVGRSSRRAYSYLLISNPNALSEEARKRLHVLQSLDDLGVGFRLAMQDMEIRGAGNLLGKDQSGQVNLIGFDLYTRVMKKAIKKIKARFENQGEEVERDFPEVEPEMSIGFQGHIPPEYIPDVSERLVLYQRLTSLRNRIEAGELFSEIEDRFGRAPKEIEQLIELMVFRACLRSAGVVSANLSKDYLSLSFHPEVPLDIDRITSELVSSKGDLRLKPPNVLMIKIASETKTSIEFLVSVMNEVFSRLGIFSVR